MNGSHDTADAPVAERRALNLDVLAAFFDAARADRRLELFAPDGVKEIPFAPPGVEPRRWEGRAELERNAAENAARFAGIRHVDVEIVPTLDPDEVWATSRLADGATLGGAPYPQRFVHRFRLRDGLIVHWQEFFDGAILADAIARARATGVEP